MCHKGEEKPLNLQPIEDFIFFPPSKCELGNKGGTYIEEPDMVLWEIKEPGSHSTLRKQ